MHVTIISLKEILQNHNSSDGIKKTVLVFIVKVNKYSLNLYFLIALYREWLKK